MEQADVRKKRFLVVLPLILMPFIILLFYFAKSGSAAKKVNPSRGRLNSSLPSPQVNENPMDKFSIYQLAEKDSLKKLDEIKSDPFFKGGQFSNRESDANSEGSDLDLNRMVGKSLSKPGKTPDSNEVKVRNKLEELERQLNLNVGNPKPVDKEAVNVEEAFSPLKKNAFDGAKSRELAYAGSSVPADSEISVLDSMLDKVLDIKYPERIEQRLRKEVTGEKKATLPVRTGPDGDGITLLRRPELAEISNTGNEPDPSGHLTFAASGGIRFYDLQEDPIQKSRSNVIAGVVHETRSIVSGESIKIRTEQDIYIENQVIPTGTLLTGICSLSGERMSIRIPQLQYNNALFAVSFTVYDYDGLAGIPVKGAISREVAGQGANNGLQSLQLGTLNPSLGAQAASAGIETAKTLFSKKVKLVKVTLKAGHPVLLKPDN